MDQHSAAVGGEPPGPYRGGRVLDLLRPALFILDGRGRVRYRHFGEGEYERSERVIQELIAEVHDRDRAETWSR